MAEKTLNTRIQLKIDTETKWNNTKDFVPKKGEIIIYEPDSNNSRYRIKIGDNKTDVKKLGFAFPIDSELNSGSINPVQNSVISTAIGNLEDFVNDPITNDEIDAICGATIYNESEVQV